MGIAETFNNIGAINKKKKKKKQGRFTVALDYYGRSLKLREELGDKSGIAYSQRNIGAVYKRQGKIKEALDYYLQSLKISEEISDKEGIAYSYISIGSIYKNQGKFKQALQYADKGLVLAKELGFPEVIDPIAKLSSELYEQGGKGMQALEMYKLYILMHDSIKNKENQKAAFKKEAQFKYEKQRAEDSVSTAKDMLVKNAEIEKQKTEIKAKKIQQYYLFGGLGLVIVFAAFMYKRYKITQKQKGIIEEQKTVVETQKHMVEEKQKEILDSINYAKRIQTALLPSEKYIHRKLSGGKN
ncbi:MAG: tetratricopeptide repeat protein [Sphingobacteriaceae bacterium]|nr:tetratricopeptide repeat protein [Sphingobacteriaceae bacterium]